MAENGFGKNIETGAENGDAEKGLEELAGELVRESVDLFVEKEKLLEKIAKMLGKDSEEKAAAVVGRMVELANERMEEELSALSFSGKGEDAIRQEMPGIVQRVLGGVVGELEQQEVVYSPKGAKAGREIKFEIAGGVADIMSGAFDESVVDEAADLLKSENKRKRNPEEESKSAKDERGDYSGKELVVSERDEKIRNERAEKIKRKVIKLAGEIRELLIEILSDAKERKDEELYKRVIQEQGTISALMEKINSGEIDESQIKSLEEEKNILLEIKKEAELKKEEEEKRRKEENEKRKKELKEKADELVDEIIEMAKELPDTEEQKELGLDGEIADGNRSFDALSSRWKKGADEDLVDDLENEKKAWKDLLKKIKSKRIEKEKEREKRREREEREKRGKESLRVGKIRENFGELEKFFQAEKHNLFSEGDEMLQAEDIFSKLKKRVDECEELSDGDFERLEKDIEEGIESLNGLKEAKEREIKEKKEREKERFEFFKNDTALVLRDLETQMNVFLRNNSDKKGIIDEEKARLLEIKKRVNAMKDVSELSELRKIHREINDRLVDFLILGGDRKSLTRRSAEIAIDKVEKYEELNIPNPENLKEVIQEKTKQALEEVVVHGRLKKNPQTGEIEVEAKTDFDGRISLDLLRAVGIKVGKKNIEYVEPGGRLKLPEGEGKLHIDTSGVDGLVLVKDDKGRIIYILVDHHGKLSGRDTSGAKWTYEILISAGLMERSESMDTLVDFVTQIDNGKYIDEERYIGEYLEGEPWKTLNGLARMASFEQLKKFFEYRDSNGNSLSPSQPMTERQLRDFGFISGSRNMSEMQKKNILEAKRNVEKMERNGLIIDSEKYGKICVNIEGKTSIGGMFDISKASGFGAHIIWDPIGEKCFITTLDGREFEEDLSLGTQMRKTMWVKPSGFLSMELKEVLEKMTDGKVEFQGELKEFLEEESNEWDAIGNYLFDARGGIEEVVRAVEELDYFKDTRTPVREKMEQVELVRERYWDGVRHDMENDPEIPNERITLIMRYIIENI